MAVAEEAILAGAYNRLTSATLGITVEAGKYCANGTGDTAPDQGGVRRWVGQVNIASPAEMIGWAQNGLTEGPVVLIVVGETVDFDTDKAQYAGGNYSLSVFIVTKNLRSRREGAIGSLDGATRNVGLWDVKADIMDRLCNHGLVSTVIDTVTCWEDPPVVKSGRLVAAQDGIYLYELTWTIKVSQIHGLVAWSDLDDLEGIDTTLTVEPDAGAGNLFQVLIKNDVP